MDFSSYYAWAVAVRAGANPYTWATIMPLLKKVGIEGMPSKQTRKSAHVSLESDRDGKLVVRRMKMLARQLLHRAESHVYDECSDGSIAGITASGIWRMGALFYLLRATPAVLLRAPPGHGRGGAQI
jgi:hypothetical protein